jgi:NADH-quinone oxidoreductase subunit N
MIVAAAAVAVYMLGAFVAARGVWPWLGLAGLVGGGVALALQGDLPATSGPLVLDGMAFYTRWLALAAGGVLMLLTWRGVEGRTRPEYVGSLLLALVGLMFVGLSGNLVLLFLGLELISIPTYILLYIGRPGGSSQEATAKYFYLSILASAMFLYGLSFLYGLGGSMQIAAIGGGFGNMFAEPGGTASIAGVALVLIFGGLGFKIAAVPFHFYAPDVYQATTNTNAALLSVLPKAAGLVALVRLLIVAMPGLEPMGWRIAMAVAVLTMTLGNVVALWQDNLRRLLAYSSIAHAGYMLIGLTVGLASLEARPQYFDGVAAMLFYLAIYAVASLGAFAVLARLSGSGRQLSSVDELAGLARSHPLSAAAMAVFMLSLAGIPPLAGFWGKLAIFAAALSVDVHAEVAALGSLRSWFIILAVIGVLNAAVAAAYYLRVVGAMYFRLPLAAPPAEGGRGSAVAVLVCAAGVLALGVFPASLHQESSRASPTSTVQATASQADRPETPPAVAAERLGAAEVPGARQQSTGSRRSVPRSRAFEPVLQESLNRGKQPEQPG